jgi:hypothetical protein
MGRAHTSGCVLVLTCGQVSAIKVARGICEVKDSRATTRI